MLMLDGRLKPLIARVKDGIDEMALLAAILKIPGIDRPESHNSIHGS
jgi:hypothetical protein